MTDDGGSNSEDGDLADVVLLAQLDLRAEKSDYWRRLLLLADDFAATAHHADDNRFVPPQENADGTLSMHYHDYGPRVVEAINVLYGVGAVTPAFDWMKHPWAQDLSSDSELSPADAVRLATTLVRGDRFSDGLLGDAVERGVLQAVIASLAAWYRAQAAYF